MRYFIIIGNIFFYKRDKIRAFIVNLFLCRRTAFEHHFRVIFNAYWK